MADVTFLRDFSGRLACEATDLSGDDYPATCAAAAVALGLQPVGEADSDGVNVVFRDYHRDGDVVELAWDNWSGFIATAKTAEAEYLVEMIGEYLSRRDAR